MCQQNHQLSDRWSRLQTGKFSNVYILHICTRWVQVSCVVLFLLLYILVYIWGTSKTVLNTFGKIFHVNFLGYVHCFMPIRISKLKYHYISVDNARYATYVVAIYIDTSTTFKKSKFHKTTLPHDMIFNN